MTITGKVATRRRKASKSKAVSKPLKNAIVKTVKAINRNIIEIKHYDHIASYDAIYSYAGSINVNLFAPTSESAARNGVVGISANLEHVDLRYVIKRNSSAPATFRVIVYYWHDVSNDPSADEIIREPPSTDNATMPICPYVDLKRKRFTVIRDKTYHIDSYESRQYHSMSINLKKRKVSYETGSYAYNPKLYMLVATNATISYPDTMHMTSRVTYSDA